MSATFSGATVTWTPVPGWVGLFIRSECEPTPIFDQLVAERGHP